MPSNSPLSPEMESKIDALENAVGFKTLDDVDAAREALRSAIRELQRKADAWDWIEPHLTLTHEYMMGMFGVRDMNNQISATLTMAPQAYYSDKTTPLDFAVSLSASHEGREGK